MKLHNKTRLPNNNHYNNNNALRSTKKSPFSIQMFGIPSGTDGFKLKLSSYQLNSRRNVDRISWVSYIYICKLPQSAISDRGSLQTSISSSSPQQRTSPVFILYALIQYVYMLLWHLPLLSDWYLTYVRIWHSLVMHARDTNSSATIVAYTTILVYTPIWRTLSVLAITWRGKEGMVVTLAWLNGGWWELSS